MQCKYPLDLNNSNPRAYAGMLRKLMPCLEEEKKPHKPKTLQHKVWWFESEFTEGFFVPLFPVFLRHWGGFVLLGEWRAGEATAGSASCLGIQCISKQEWASSNLLKK